MGFDCSAAYQHEIHHYSCSEGPHKRKKKKVLGVLCRFFAVSVLMHPDYFPVRPDRRDKGQKKVSVFKRKHSRLVNDPSGACITLRVRKKKEVEGIS